jgi:hypothetical protein
MNIHIHTLNLKNKLTTLDIFKKRIPKNIKKMHLVHVLLICGLQIHIFNLFKPICSCNILHIIYDKNKNKSITSYLILSYKNVSQII